MSVLVKSKFSWAIVICFFWYLALFPGRLGFDSALAIRMIQDGKSTDWWSALFFWFLKLSTLGGKTIAIASLIQLAVLFFAILNFIRSLPINREAQNSTLLIIVATPLFGVFGLGVSHDVFQSAGILFLLSLEFKKFFSNHQYFEYSRKEKIGFGVYLVFCLSMSKVGLLILLVYAVILVIRRNFASALAIVISTVTLFAVSSVGISSQASGYYLWPVFADLKCVAQHVEAEISVDEWTWLEEYAPKELWLTPISCSSMDQAVEALGFRSSIELAVDLDFVKKSASIIGKNPAIVFMAHVNRSRVALPPPFFPIPANQTNMDPNWIIGEGTNTALQSGPEVLHPSIDEPSMKVDKGLFELLEIVAQAPTLMINQASWFWGWGGLWLWPILFIFIAKLKPLKKRLILIANWPTMILHMALFAVAPTSLPRYVMSTILCGVIVSIGATVEYLQKRSFSNLRS